MEDPTIPQPPGLGFGSGHLGLSPDTEVIETVGNLIEFWGFKRALGRVWALLYLSPTAQSAHDIGEKLGMSSGAVSMTLNELQVWGVVSRVHKPGERKEYFAAEDDILKMVTRVLSDRELRQIENACDTFSRAEETFAQQSADAKQKKAVGAAEQHEFQRSRVAHLHTIANAGKTLLRGFILTSKLDASPLRKLGPFRSRSRGPRS